jgi:hypothetical protein
MTLRQRHRIVSQKNVLSYKLKHSDTAKSEKRGYTEFKNSISEIARLNARLSAIAPMRVPKDGESNRRMIPSSMETLA